MRWPTSTEKKITSLCVSPVRFNSYCCVFQLVKITARKLKQNHRSEELQHVPMKTATKLGGMNCFKYSEQSIRRLTVILGVVPLN